MSDRPDDDDDLWQPLFSGNTPAEEVAEIIGDYQDRAIADFAAALDTFDGQWAATPARKAAVIAHFAPRLRAHVAEGMRAAHARLQAGE